MAKILSSHCLVPSIAADAASAVLRLDTLELPKALAENRGLLRSMGRAGTILAACAHGAGESFLAPISADPNGVAIYCAADHSLGSHSDLLRLVDRGDEPMSAVFGRLIGPKWGLQTSVGLIAASLSILLSIRGGVHTFHHSRFACRQALAQAQLDLESGACRLALVCSASTADDPLTIHKQRADFPGAAYAEGAAALLLAAGGAEIHLVPAAAGALRYGIADELIHYTLGGKNGG